MNFHSSEKKRHKYEWKKSLPSTVDSLIHCSLIQWKIAINENTIWFSRTAIVAAQRAAENWIWRIIMRLAYERDWFVLCIRHSTYLQFTRYMRLCWFICTQYSVKCYSPFSIRHMNRRDNFKAFPGQANIRYMSTPEESSVASYYAMRMYCR